MNILEQELEDVIWNAIESGNCHLLSERGLPIDTTAFTYTRQLELSKYGRADIVGFSVKASKPAALRKIEVQIIELKKELLNTDVLLQAVRYAKAISHKLEHEDIKAYISFHIILIGKTICKKSDWLYFPDIVDNISLFTYAINLENGIVFRKQDGFSLIDPGFNGSKKITPILQQSLIKNIDYNKWLARVQEDLPF